jgi:hypothetical protein
MSLISAQQPLEVVDGGRPAAGAVPGSFPGGGACNASFMFVSELWSLLEEGMHGGIIICCVWFDF